MPTLNFRDVRRYVECNGPQACQTHLTEALHNGELVADDFTSLRSLFEAVVTNSGGDIVGRDVIDQCFDPRRGGSFGANLAMMESAGAVTTAAFSNITGQIFYNKIMAASTAEEFSVSAAIPNVPTQLDGEKMAGITGIGNQTQIVPEGSIYPLAGVGEDYIETPRNDKRGLIVPVTKEAVFYDRTGQLLAMASKVGESLGVDKELRAIDALIDQNRTGHRYRWRGTTYATYQTSTPWINKKTSNGLVDYTNADAAEQLLANMVDPNTGLPMIVKADTIICCPQLANAAFRVTNAMLAVLQSGGFAATGNLVRTEGPSPLGKTRYSGSYSVISNRYIPTRLATDTDWFLGSPRTALQYSENWPITVLTAPPNSEVEFTQDIVYRYKATEKGNYATIEPRELVWNVA